jgi:hypothetical protein
MNFMRIWEDLSPWARVGIAFVIAVVIIAVIGAIAS